MWGSTRSPHPSMTFSAGCLLSFFFNGLLLLSGLDRVSFAPAVTWTPLETSLRDEVEERHARTGVNQVHALATMRSIEVSRANSSAIFKARKRRPRLAKRTIFSANSSLPSVGKPRFPIPSQGPLRSGLPETLPPRPRLESEVSGGVARTARILPRTFGGTAAARARRDISRFGAGCGADYR